MSARSARPAPARTEPPLWVVGAGAAGTALARAWHIAGWPVERLACRSLERARERVALAGCGEPCTIDDLAPAATPCLLLLGVPDRHIAAVAEQLARHTWPAGSLALHLSGAVEVEALAALGRAGCAIGGLHPLKSFVDPERDAAGLAGTVFACDGDPPALALAEQLAARVEARPFRLAAGRRPAWHAAAAHAANHLVALLDQALDLAAAAGLERDAARRALLPLMTGTLENLAHHPPGAALTGPVVRGDVQAVRRHSVALADVPADVGAGYRALARRALQLAERERDLPPDAAEALRAVLSPASDGDPP